MNAAEKKAKNRTGNQAECRTKELGEEKIPYYSGKVGRLVGAPDVLEATRLRPGVCTFEYGKCHRVATSSVVIIEGT